MEASIQAVSPELIWELRMTEGSVIEGAGGEGSAHARGVHSASKPTRNHRDITVITRLPRLACFLTMALAPRSESSTAMLLGVACRDLVVTAVPRHLASP